MTQKLGANIFESLFKMAYQPFFVDGKQQNSDQKNHFPTIFSAVSSANYNSLIKVNEGLYNQNIQIKTPNIKVQTSQPNTNAIIISSNYPSISICLPLSSDKISFQSLKFAHLCEQHAHIRKIPSHKKLKENQYRHLQIGKGNIDTCILISKGSLYLDECRLSLAAQKDPTKLVPSIVVEKQGTLVMTRCQIRGSIGSIGILLKGGKIIISESNFKHNTIGILAVGNKNTSIIVKNSFFYNCEQGIVLNGPFEGSIENNIVAQCQENGINVLTGNRCKLLNNEIRECRTGIKIENCCPIMMKNTISKNKKYGVECYSTRNLLCFPLVKFNFINQNEKGGIYLNGNGNKTEIFNNQLSYNNKIGIKVQKSASPHILLNDIKNTLGTGLHILPDSTAFIQKNNISGSLKCNIMIQGPNNIGNYIYNNIIQESRGEGLMLLNSENFLINNNMIRKNNNNGILCITSVVTFEQNIISENKNNGVLLVDDNDIQMTENEITDNKKTGLVIRNTSTGEIIKNWFINNNIEIVVENNTKGLQNIEEDNYFGRKLNIQEMQEQNKINTSVNIDRKNGKTKKIIDRKANSNYIHFENDVNVDIRIPKNYAFCQII